MYILTTHNSGYGPILAVAGGAKNNFSIFFERLAMIEEKQPFRNIIVIMESDIHFFFISLFSESVQYFD